MERMIFYTHSGWRYIVILVAVLALLKMLLGMLGGRRWGKLDQALGAAFPIIFDIQLLFGIILWGMQFAAGIPSRQAAEHPVTMILAIAAAHIGWSRAKKSSSDADKFRAAFVGFLIATLLMSLGVARMTGMMG